jgi:hypothetical protein
MRIRTLPCALALALILGSAACVDLSGPKLDNDPNRPTVSSNASLFAAAQANMFVFQEGHLTRTICMWLQQCAGVAQQYLANAVYQVTEDEFYNQWTQVYAGGGLIDLRTIQRQALAKGDSAFAGVALVYEAWFVGIAADLWGDIPYSESANPAINAPHLDTQQSVYATLQARLDTAIIDLAGTGPGSVGPEGADLAYGGDLAKWTALAHTLKARLHLHTAEQLGAPAYASALAEAQLGIQSPAGDYFTIHAANANEANIWFQFLGAWQGYIAPGNYIIDSLMVPRSDPRLSTYFTPAPAGPNAGLYVGAINGVDFDNAAVVSQFGPARASADSPQPLATWAENQLIIAEAAYQGGDEPTAVAALEAERANAGDTLPLAPVPTGQALLDAIMTEKYVVTFQTNEVWNDYNRTCIPRLTPVAGASGIPARIVYPLSERNANPSIPDQGPLRNWNDPVGCP